MSHWRPKHKALLSSILIGFSGYCQAAPLSGFVGHLATFVIIAFVAFTGIAALISACKKSASSTSGLSGLTAFVMLGVIFSTVIMITVDFLAGGFFILLFLVIGLFAPSSQKSSCITGSETRRTKPWPLPDDDAYVREKEANELSEKQARRTKPWPLPDENDPNIPVPDSEAVESQPERSKSWPL